MKKTRVGVIFGGKSGEHEVSVRSATSIFRALDPKKYEIVLLGVDKIGKWLPVDQKWLPIGAGMKALPDGNKSIEMTSQKIDVAFPIIHGTYGEDGSLQGMLEMLDVAYVGAGVLGSAVGMDKDVQKRLLSQAGIDVAKSWVIRKPEKIKVNFPVYVKPVNMGSSVGVSRVSSISNLVSSIDKAFKYDTTVIIEEEIIGREIEVSVLGNDDPIASVPGEVIPVGHEFYDYEAKYIDENGAQLVVPAAMTKSQIAKIKKVAIKAYKTLECSGMARVDMFLTPTGKIVVNEINTLPGFTSISMYPKLWEASGLSYAKLLDKLIELAIEKKKQKDGLKRSFR